MNSPLPLSIETTPDLFAGLNPAQAAAAQALDGPVLVLAGAGTGKTRVLATRLAHILLSGRAGPFQIMAVTFTNKAAREMQERVQHLIGRPTEGWYLGTFHALCARILRKHAERIGLKSNFTILDADDQLRLVKQILEAENVDTKRTPARAVAAVIERWKDKGLTPEKVPASEVTGQGLYLKVYTLYQERLKNLNACDFGDLLLHNLALLQNHPDLLQEYQHRFRYVLVDEYQDTNVAQYLWLRLLMLGADGQGRNLCCVGDEDQSIYGWRGAEIGNILRFEQDFPGAQVIRLEENYRSTGHILSATAALIAHNRNRLGKTLWTAGQEGDKLRVHALWDGVSEARFVGDEIEAFQRRGTRLNNMAVLVRAGFQTREFEERLLSIGVPYRVIGGPRFYERQEIRDALAYLRLVQVTEDDLAFERIINVPKRSIGAATIQQIAIAAREQGGGMLEAVRRLLKGDNFNRKPRTTLEAFIRQYDVWRGQKDTLSHPELASRILEESGYVAMWQAEKTPDAAGRLENLKELVSAMGEFDTLQGFLEHVSLVMEASNNANQDQVSLMTLHAAKGLEFDLVFLPGWEEEIFPSRRTLEESGMKGLEEERRLAYVGITRARKHVIISHVASRMVHGSWTHAIPSRFISELPEKHIEKASEPGMFAATTRPAPFFRTSQSATSAPASSFGPSHYPPRPKVSVIEGKAKTTAVREALFRKGDRVFHQKFGYGTVVHEEAQKLDITFDQAGDKKVMSDFVVPESQAGQE
jgi:DNA helicase-2/ATP-dependent DNA helicase PcrA